MEKIKIYLDTNTVLDFFINQAKAVKKNEEAITPEKFKFFVENLDKIEFHTSILTYAEIARELITGLHMTETYFEELWIAFTKILNCNFITNITIDKRFSSIVTKIRMKLRTLINFQHLFVAMDNNLLLLSGDKDLIIAARENKVYDKIMSYIELREFIASFSFSPTL